MKTVQVNEAAEKFFRQLCPDREYAYNGGDVATLVRAAFLLYEESWGETNFDIRDWKWPATELAEGGHFEDSQPWCVLFREAVALAKAGCA